MDPFYNWVIQPSNQRINLIDSIKLILDFSEEFSYISFENVKTKKWMSDFNLVESIKIIKHFM